MKYSFAVEKKFKLFSDLPGSRSFDNYQLQIIKRYMQWCYEAGFAAGYAERIYKEDEENESEYNDNGIDTRTGEPFYKF